ncbi:hypothetical protein ACWDKQ_33915 [Saccharopolyspora sp. NPDC000995]
MVLMIAFGAVLQALDAWLVSGLYLATAVGSPTAGRLADLFGPRRVLLASVAAPFAPTSGWMKLRCQARIVAGWTGKMSCQRPGSSEDRPANQKRSVGLYRT